MSKVVPVKKIIPLQVPVKDKYKYGGEVYSDIFALINDLDVEEESFYIEVNYVKTKQNIRVDFGIVPFNSCCGVLEVGGFSRQIMSDKDMDLMFAHFFKQSSGKTFAITTIQSQTAWETYLKKTKLFQAVKTFKNITGNTITLWVSTN